MSRFSESIGAVAPVIIAALLAMAAPALGQDPALQDGLAASWSFDDGSGTIVDDAMNGADGTIVGSCTWTTGVLGGALDVNNMFVGNGVYLGNPSSLDLGTNQCTISTWINLPALPSAGPTGFQGIFDSALDGYIFYVVPGIETIRFKVLTADESNETVGYARMDIHESHFTANAWHNLVATFDGTFAKVYCDGTLVDMGGISAVGSQIKSGQYAGISYQPEDPTDPEDKDDFYTTCKYDDTAVWNRALNANEVAYLYNGGAGNAVMASNPTIAPPAMPDPVVRLRFDGDALNSGTGGTTYDGTIVDGAAGSHSYEPGKLGQGLRLDNPQDTMTGGDYVSTPYTMTEEGTITFWCKPGDFFNHLAVFDNSGDANDWEMWIYGDGRMRWRIEDAYVTKNLNDLSGANEWYHVAVNWYYDSALGSGDANITMFVNGEYIGRGEGNWVDPGDTFYLGGGNDGNDLGNGVFDDLRIYDAALSAEQIAEIYGDVDSVPGDTDNDGDVDQDDAATLAANWGNTVSGGASVGDFNGDNVVDMADASILAAAWTGSQEAAPVPEPSVLALLACSLVLLVRRRW